MKSDYQAAPVFLKKTERVEALMFARYMADLVAAIIQRQLRTAMKTHGIRQLQTLPEERPSETPTWEQIQRLFAHQAKYRLTENGKLVAIFSDKLDEHQQQVLTLLRVSDKHYLE